jgi:hypothetical protein
LIKPCFNDVFDLIREKLLEQFIHSKE